MVRIDDDGKYWVWIRHHSRAAGEITGKILFFSNDRETLIAIARVEIEEHGFAHAKVSRTLQGTQTDFVLCLYDTGSERVAEVRRRHPEARCPGWKSDAATDRGIYSNRYLATLPSKAGMPIAETATPNTIVSSGGGDALTLEQAIRKLVDPAVQKRIRSSDYRYMAIDASFGGHAVGSGRRRTRGKFAAEDWKAIIRAWTSEGPEAACDEFSMRWGSVALGGTLPEISEIEWIGLMP